MVEGNSTSGLYSYIVNIQDSIWVEKKIHVIKASTLEYYGYHRGEKMEY